MGRQVFTAGEILTAASMNDLGDQTVMVFDDATARATAIPTPVEGMVTYLKDTDEVDKFDGSAFVPVGIAPAILQVVSTTKTDTFTASGLASGSITTVSGFSATITPSSEDSKVVVFVNLDLGVFTDPALESPIGFGVIVKRGATAISVGDEAGSRTRITYGQFARADRVTTGGGAVILDTPATTSATTYTVDLLSFQATTATLFVNRTNDNTDAARIGRGASRITLMEVAG